jgi:hypothetical protein
VETVIVGPEGSGSGEQRLAAWGVAAKEEGAVKGGLFSPSMTTGDRVPDASPPAGSVGTPDGGEQS